MLHLINILIILINKKNKYIYIILFINPPFCGMIPSYVACPLEDYKKLRGINIKWINKHLIRILE